MQALLPEIIEVQMFQKIAAVAALCLPTFAQAELVEFTCRNPLSAGSSVDLSFNTETNHVQFGSWPIAEVTIWREDFIYWTNLKNPTDGYDVAATAYMFHRETGQLFTNGVSKSLWDAVQDGKQITEFFYQCSRPL